VCIGRATRADGRSLSALHNQDAILKLPGRFGVLDIGRLQIGKTGLKLIKNELEIRS
jgi:hypothetical protein